MGKISKGILGGFSGKAGSVVGATWKGIAVYKNSHFGKAIFFVLFLSGT